MSTKEIQLDKAEQSLTQAQEDLCRIEGDNEMWKIISDLIALRTKLKIYKEYANSSGDSQQG
jgi:hypothetical protein